MSELYKLPNGWEWINLDKYSNVTSSKRVHKKDYIKNGIPFFRSKEIILKSKSIEPTDILYISENTFDEFKLKFGVPKNGDILITAVGTLGVTYLVDNNDKFYFKDGNLLWIREIKDSVNRKYLLYYFKSPIFINDIDKVSKGAAQKALTITKLIKLNIPLPPLHEQKRIVSKLDILFQILDKAIALHQKNIDEADVFMGSVLNDVFGELEEKYDNKTTKELCIKITDGTHSTPKYIDRGIPFLSVKNISKGFIDFKDTKFVSKEEHILLSKRCNVEFDDILYTKVGTTGIAKVVNTKKEFSIFVSIALLKPKKDLIISMFFQYILNSPNCYEQAQSRTRGVANRNLVLKDIKQINFPVPPLNIQQKTVVYLDSTSQKIEKLKSVQKEKMQSLIALKASILDKAFRGEL